jgi:cytochrome c-type biogenesis protein CcmH/NrfG
MLRALTSALLLAALAAAPALASEPAAAAELLAAGRVDDAVAGLEKRVKQAPEDAPAFHLLSRAYLMQERWEEAERAAEQAVRLQPRNSEYHLWLGRAYGERASRAGMFRAMRLAGRVRDSFQRAVELDPSNVAAHRDLAEYYIEAPGIVGGGRDKARAQAERVAPLDAAAAHWIRARLAEKEQDLAAAEKHYRVAIQASDRNGAQWLDLAGFYRRQERYKEMEEAIERAVTGAARSPEHLLGAAQLLVRAGRKPDAAIQLLRMYLAGQTVAEAPRFVAHYLLGTLLEKKGEREAAVAEYRAALALASGYQPAREALQRAGLQTP